MADFQWVTTPDQVRAALLQGTAAKELVFKAQDLASVLPPRAEYDEMRRLLWAARTALESYDNKCRDALRRLGAK